MRIFSARPGGRCGGDVDVGEEESFYAVGLVGEEGAVGADYGWRGGRGRAGEVNSGEITGVLSGATQRGFFMEGVGGIGEGVRGVAAGLGLAEKGMEDDVGSVTGGSTHELGITQPS